RERGAGRRCGYARGAAGGGNRRNGTNVARGPSTARRVACEHRATFPCSPFRCTVKAGGPTILGFRTSRLSDLGFTHGRASANDRRASGRRLERPRGRAHAAGVQADGTCWAGATVWQGRTALPISVSSWATTEDDVERSLEAMLRVATV